MPLPSLPALRVFEAAGRLGSFTKAAAALNVTQAAVSHQIRSLEDQLGARLFTRTTRSLALTPAGRRLLPRLSEAFATIVQGVEDVRRGERVLAVTTVHSFGSLWLAPRLRRLMDRHPELEVQIRYSTALADFARDGVDVGIRWGRGSWPGLTAELIGRSTLVAVASPAYVAERGLAQRADLSRATLLHEETRADWMEWLTTAGIDPGLAAHGPLLGDDASLVNAALADQGVALIPEAFVARHLAEGQLTRIFDLPSTEGYGFYVVYQPGGLDIARVRAFRDFVHAEMAADERSMAGGAGKAARISRQSAGREEAGGAG